MTLAPFRRALGRLGRYVRDLARAGVSLRYLDFGGGLGVRYWKEQPLAPAVYARAVAAMVRPLGCHLLLEPGRSIVAPAGVLLTRVLYTKRNRGKRFVIVDAAMNDFLRPALYDAVHPITPARLAARRRPGGRLLADIVGPVCETGDCFLQDWPLGEVAAGRSAGACGARSVRLRGGVELQFAAAPRRSAGRGRRFRVIRRRESRSDLVRGE